MAVEGCCVLKPSSLGPLGYARGWWVWGLTQTEPCDCGDLWVKLPEELHLLQTCG